MLINNRDRFTQMRKIEVAHEILSESRRSTQVYLESGRDYDKVKSHMYSIFECYAHGLITWNQVRSRWHSSILEYLNLYASRPDLYLSESNRMLGEYENTLNTFKPALDEYKRVTEQKMTSNIVVKGKLNESQAKDQSNVYFNRRALNESELKDTATMKTWKRVQESYPNLTSKDELRIRMLTVFEGSTVDTTKLVTTYMSEEPTAISGPMQTSMRPKPRPTNLGNVDSASIDAAVKQALGQTSPRPMPRPANLGNDPQSIGAGSQVAYMDNGAVDGSTRGVDPSEIYSPEQIAILRGEAPPSLAPTTSPRPMPRPKTLNQSANNNIRKEAAAIFNKIKVAANEGYKVLPPMDKERYGEIPGLEGPFTTLSGKVVYYDPKEGAYYDRDSDMYLSNDEYTALNSDYSGMQDERDINVREADVPLSRPNYMDTKNNPEIASAFEKQRQNWLKTNPWGGDVDDLNDLVNFGNKVNKVGNTKAAATLTKQSMDYFKNNPGRGLGEADTWSKPMSHPDYMDYKNNPEIASAFEKQRQNYLNTIPSNRRNGAIRQLNDIVDTGNVFAAAKTGLPDNYLPHAKVRQVITKQSMDYFKNNPGRGLGEAKAKPGHNARVMANNLSKVFKAKPDFLDMDKDGDKEEPMKKAAADSKKKVDEKAKWRSSSAAKKITDPDKDLGMADYDYHHENPRSTGRLKSTADTEPSDGSINNRAKSKTNSMGKRKGMVSKADINRVKSNAFNTLNKEEVELDEAGAFSYGKKPRKGTVAYNAAEQRKKQEKNEKLIEPKDQKVGNAKITKEGDIPLAHPNYMDTKNNPEILSAFEKQRQNWLKTGPWPVDVERLNDLVNFGNKIPGPLKAVDTRPVKSTLTKGSMNYFKDKPGIGQERVDALNSFIALNKDKVDEAPLLGPQGKIHRAASADQSDREYASQKSFKDAWTAKNVGKKWPGYSEAGYKHPAYKKEESAVNEAVTLDYSRYMRAHGKKPRDAGIGSSTWMFTTADFGDPSEDEIFQFQGSFADAKKAAAKWAKSQGEYRFYVMESFNKSVKEAGGYTGMGKRDIEGEKAVDAALRGAVDNFTIGTGKYARAAADYGIKNLGSLAGISDPTTWDTEINQELEKDQAAQRDYPVAWDIGDKVATAAQVASGVGAVKALGTAAVRAGLRAAADSAATRAAAKVAAKKADDNLRYQARGMSNAELANATKFSKNPALTRELQRRQELANLPNLPVPKPLNLTPQMRVPPAPLKLTPNQIIPGTRKIIPFPKKP